ncbi:MAG: dTDP-4-dehydrorhamnose 3,5-epimerase [Nitrospirota bacterium]
MPFIFEELSLPGVILIRPRLFTDERGFFMEAYKHSDFARAGIPGYFVQDNHSKSGRGTLRGLHYQKSPAAQGKLVRCLKGSVYDVAADIRRGSPTYGQWIGVELAEGNSHMLYIPPAFAHGFAVLSDTAEVLYKCTAEYSPDHERGIVWNDPDLAIAWPVSSPVLSEKDKRLPSLRNADNNFEYREAE